MHISLVDMRYWIKATFIEFVMFKKFHFLQMKFELLEKLKPQFSHPNTLKTNTVLVKFYGKNEIPKVKLENTLPILLHSCPEDFSTIAYFEVNNRMSSIFIDLY